MNLLSTILDRLNQRIEAGNIFDQIYGLSELVGEGNDRAWAHYIGNGQAIPVTNFDAKQGTLFWAKRGKITVAKNESLRLAGCKSIYETRFSMTAYAMVRKSHLPCDSADAQDWIASRVLRLISGTDPQFKTAIGVVAYEVVPSGYVNEIRYLPVNYEWAAVAIDVDVNVSTTSEDGCYDTCATGDIPLPDFEPCTPCLTEVAVDGVTITGNGTEADPLVAIGGGGGTPLTVKEEGTNVSTNTTTLNFTGAGVTASLTSPGVVEVNVPGGGGGGGVTSVTGTAPIASSGGATPDISISQASSSSDGYLSQTDWNTFDGKFDTPTGTSSDYLDGTGAPTPFPTLTNGTVTSVAATVPNPTNPAFSVAVPNPTTTPSIDITANGLVSQYVRGDGSLANFPLGGGGGASVNYYLNGSISQGTIGGNTYFQMSRVPVLGGGTNFTRTNAQGNGYIAQFITDAGDPNLLAIPSGNWNFETYFNASSGGGNPSFYMELYKYDGATFTLISSGSTNPEAITGGTVVDLYVSALAVPSTVLLATDRLAVRIFVTTSGRNITLHTEDNNLCQVITTFTTGLNALNGLTAQVQNFATGTSGTDFGITSATDTHTFNLPTASASNRGALSSTDWTTFNGKFNTPTGTTAEYIRGDGSLATFPTTGTVTTVSATVPSPASPALSVNVSNPTTTPAIAITANGTTAQYIRGDGSLATLPSASSTPYVEGELIGSLGNNSNNLDMLVAPSINRLYVPFFAGNVTYIFNTSTNALVATLSTTGVNGVFYIASIGELWVTYFSSSNISRFNATTGASAGADITGSGNRGQHYIEYSSTKVFIANSGSNTVTVVNPTTLTVTATIATGTFPRGMVLNSNPSSAQNDRIAVVCPSSNNMLLINPATNAVTIAAINVGSQMSQPNSIVYDAISDRYIVANVGNNRLLYITPATATTFAYDTYTDCYRPWELSYNPSTRYVYIGQPTPTVSVFNPTSLAVVDAATKQMIRQIATSSFDRTNVGLAITTIDTTNGYVYLTSYGGETRILKIKI